MIGFWFCFRRTSLGVGLYAIGNDELAAQAHAVNVIRTRVAAYVLSGVFAAVAGLFMAASSTSGDALTGNGYTLRSIVAVVLGGVKLFGGRGTPVGAIVGAFVSAMIVNILFFAAIDPLYQSFFEGLFLIVAVLASGGVGHFMRARGLTHGRDRRHRKERRPSADGAVSVTQDQRRILYAVAAAIVLFAAGGLVRPGFA